MLLGLRLWLCFCIWGLFEPLLKRHKSLHNEGVSLSRQLQQQTLEIETINTLIEQGVNREAEARRNRLLDEVKSLDEEIAKGFVNMIPPRLMPQVLERVLREQRGLQLLSLENRPVQAMILQQESSDEPVGDGADGSPQGLFKHGFVLTLSGGYMDTINYLAKLQELPWRFYWDSVLYEVDEYPNAVITLEVHTVSTSREWIGV